jgi:hypothetical protein
MSGFYALTIMEIIELCLGIFRIKCSESDKM